MKQPDQYKRKGQTKICRPVLDIHHVSHVAVFFYLLRNANMEEYSAKWQVSPDTVVLRSKQNNLLQQTVLLDFDIATNRHSKHKLYKLVKMLGSTATATSQLLAVPVLFTVNTYVYS